MKKFIYLGTLFIILSCSTKKNLPLSISSQTNKNENVYLRIDYQGRYALAFPTYLIIENISSNNKVLRSISFVTYTQSFYPYIYRENGDNYMQPIPILKRNEKIIFKVDMLIPIDSIQTKKILEYYKLSNYPTLRDTITVSKYEDFIDDLNKIRISKDSTLYNQIFKDIIFMIPVINKVHDKEARIIEYDWLKNKTYDKYPNSEMIDIVK